MKPILLDLPDDSKDWPEWLERQLVGLRLRALIDQLKLVVKPMDQLTLDEVCGPELPEALERGLVAFSDSQICKLMAHPDLLLDLQERVFLEGSAYWDDVPRDDAHIDAVVDQLPLIKQRIRVESAIDEVPSQNIVPVRQTESIRAETRPGAAPIVRPKQTRMTSVRRSPSFWIDRRMWIGVGTLAATLLLLLSWRFMSPPKPAWGFSKSDLATVSARDASYLSFLESRAGDWFNKTPTNDQELDKRLSEFIIGCDALSRAPHLQLTNPQDRSWLVMRCNFWKSQLVEIRASLQAKSRAFSDAQGDANKVIRDIQQELMERGMALG